MSLLLKIFEIWSRIANFMAISRVAHFYWTNVYVRGVLDVHLIKVTIVYSYRLMDANRPYASVL